MINGLTEVDMQIYESELKTPIFKNWSYTSLMSLDKDLLSQVIKKETLMELRVVKEGSLLFNYDFGNSIIRKSLINAKKSEDSRLSKEVAKNFLDDYVSEELKINIQNVSYDKYSNNVNFSSEINGPIKEILKTKQKLKIIPGGKIINYSYY